MLSKHNFKCVQQHFIYNKEFENILMNNNNLFYVLL